MDINLFIKQILFSVISSSQLPSNSAQCQKSHRLSLLFCNSKSPDGIANYLPTMTTSVQTCSKVKTMPIFPSSTINHKSFCTMTFCWNTTTLFYQVLNIYKKYWVCKILDMYRMLDIKVCADWPTILYIILYYKCIYIYFYNYIIST